MWKWILVLPAVLLACAVVAPADKVDAAAPGIAEGGSPIAVGSSAGEGEGRTKIKGKTADDPEAAKGKLTMDLKNTTERSVTDLHISIKRFKANIAGAAWTDIDETMGVKIGSVQTSAIDDDDMPNHTTDENSVTVKCDAGDSIAKGNQLKVTVKITQANGTPWELAEVELEAHWTSDDVEVSATSTDDIGAARPVTGLASVVPNYFPDTAELIEGIDVATCNDICLAERDNYRFQDGSIVLSPDNSSSFAMDANTEILAFDESGDSVSNELGRVDVTNPRIDDRGNFVFDISREADGSDAEHIVLVIRGLKVSGLDNHGVGEEVHGSVSGAGVSGYCMHDIYTLVKVVAEE